MPTLTSNVNKATYLIKVHTARQQAFARFQMPVTLADNSTHSKTTPEAKWTPIKDKAHAASLVHSETTPEPKGTPVTTGFRNIPNASNFS